MTMEPNSPELRARKRLGYSALIVFGVGLLPVWATPKGGAWYGLGVLACALLLAVHIPRLAYAEGQQSRGARHVVFANLLLLTPVFTGTFPVMVMSFFGALLAGASLFVIGVYSAAFLAKQLFILLPYDWLIRKLFDLGQARWRRREAEADARSGADVHRDGVDRLP